MTRDELRNLCAAAIYGIDHGFGDPPFNRLDPGIQEAYGRAWDSALSAAPQLRQCPDCMFTFDATHTDEDGGYSCPNCAEERLSDALASANVLNERLVAFVRMVDATNGVGQANWKWLSIKEKARALLQSIPNKGDGSND